MKKIAFAAIAAIVASASPAAAHDIRVADNGAFRVAIPYGDLNLASPEGLKSLNGRVKAAANQLCWARPVTNIVEHREMKACRSEVMKAARPQVELAAAARNGGGVALAARR